MGGIADGVVGAGDDNSSSSSPWIRHPVGDINITLADTNLHADNCSTAGCGGWLDPDIVTPRTRYADGTSAGVDGDEQPFCLSCHYAHGGGNPNFATNPNLDHSMLVFTDDQDSNSGTPGLVNIESGYDITTGGMVNTCQQCHNQ